MLGLVSLKTLLHNKQRPLSLIRTNVLQKSRPTKLLFHALPNCKPKSTLQLDSINTNNSTSVEQNCQPLAQNKFNTRRPIQKLTGLPRPTNYFHSSRLKITSHLNNSLRIGFI